MSTEPTEFAPGDRGARAVAPAIAVEADGARRELGGSSRAGERRLVWDLPLRAFHWLFAASILAFTKVARSRALWLENLITYMKNKPGVWFATHEQVAQYLKTTLLAAQ